MAENAYQTTELFSDKSAIAAAFGRAAQTYDRSAAFQRDVGLRLLSRLPEDLTGLSVLDLGCGTGFFTKMLAERGAEVTACDLSSAMLEKTHERCQGFDIRYVQADAEALPFSPHEFDLVFSSLALQWCVDFSVPVREVKRALKSKGQLFFSTLADGSLCELRHAWSEVDSYQHVNDFITPSGLNIALAQADSHGHQLDFEAIQVCYPSAIALMKDLKGIGATHLQQGRTQGLQGKAKLVAVEKAYNKYRNKDGQLPATYQVCLGVITND